ncbi:MAG TPA: C4-type zinc ribbon domain-containing protein [Candidatus Acidoferrales bacterium]|nr:C4-type zinc ribbon domain-containing protein [Candidatus Acidoferrales bacterium]
MHTGLKELLHVQMLDLKLAELAGQLAQFPRRIAEVDAQVEAARASLSSTREAQSSSLKDRKKLELDVESWKDKVRKYKDQTAQVKTNEAYRALLHEIEGGEAQIRKAEDAVLEHMVTGEEHDRQVKRGEKALAEAETSAKSSRAAIEAERATLAAQQSALRADRDSAASAVPPALLDRYRIYAPRHHGVAVATLDGEACSGCRVHLRPHVVQRLKRPENDQIVECESCGRMLYYEEPPAAPAPSPEVAAAAHKQDSSGG